MTTIAAAGTYEIGGRPLETSHPPLTIDAGVGSIMHDSIGARTFGRVPSVN